MADDLGRHYCGGRMISAELSCAIGRRGGSEIAILLPGYTCTQCGTPQLHSDQVQVLEEVLTDVNALAAEIVREATDESPPEAEKPEQPEKNPAAVELGRRGGLKGGKARAAKMTPEERSEIARRAAAARWAGKESSGNN